MKHIFILMLFVTALAAAAQQQVGPLSPERILVNPSLKPFYHGVASGDPLADRVILWTRVTPDSSVTGAVSVNWEIALDTLFTQVINNGTFVTDANRDYTVKVDATGLQDNTYYYYRFEALGNTSLMGRTKTLPAGNVDTLRFAVVSCSNFAIGFFHAYQSIAERNDVDALIHLGDYIYEYGDVGFIPERSHNPAYEILNLMDYRLRHSQYKLDPQLRCAHQQYPFICVWDDHETANNSWAGGAENHDPLVEGNWEDRKAAGIKAYQEWMPIRIQDSNDSTRIFRNIQYGNLANLIMLDTRLYGREEQTTSANNDTTRTLLGTSQLQWFKNQLDSANGKWNLIGQQVMVAPLKVFGFPVNLDQWDGYPAERKKIYDHVLTHNIDNLVVLTGDIHSSWGNDLPYDNSYDPNTGANSVGVEFVTTSVTSSNSPISVGLAILQSQNEHIKYAELASHGYIILDVNANRVQGDWYYVDNITNPDTFTTEYAEGWYANDGERFLRKASQASVSSSIINQPQAPCVEEALVGIEANSIDNLSILATYPNPFTANFVVEYHLQKTADLSMELRDMQGKLLKTMPIGTRAAGLYVIKIETADLPIGAYFLTVFSNGKACSKVLLKR